MLKYFPILRILFLLLQTHSHSMDTRGCVRAINNSKHSHADSFSIVLRCFSVKYRNYKLHRGPVACANTHRAAGCGRAASHGKSDSELPELESRGCSKQSFYKTARGASFLWVGTRSHPAARWMFARASGTRWGV